MRLFLCHHGLPSNLVHYPPFLHGRTLLEHPRVLLRESLQEEKVEMPSQVVLPNEVAASVNLEGSA